jgi:hypothetical protein
VHVVKMTQGRPATASSRATPLKISQNLGFCLILHLDQTGLQFHAFLQCPLPVLCLFVARRDPSRDVKFLQQAIDIGRDDKVLVHFSEDGGGLVRRVHVDEVLQESSGDAGVDLRESATTGSHKFESSVPRAQQVQDGMAWRRWWCWC